MAIILKEIYFSLDDYFDSHGFGDGDDGSDVMVGYPNMDLAIKILNTALKKYKSKFKAVQLEISGIHNNCRLCLRVKKGDYVDLTVDEGKCLDVGLTQEGMAFVSDETDKVKKAYADAYKKFDTAIARKARRELHAFLGRKNA